MKPLEVTEYTRLEEGGYVLREYIRDMYTYVRTKYPHLSEDQITINLRKIVTDRLHKPTLSKITHETPGNAKVEVQDLLEFTDNNISSCITTPSGTSYIKTEINPAFTKLMVQDQLRERSRVKNLMLDEEAAGKIKSAQIKNSIQSRIKIGVNALSGGMNNPGNCFYDPAGYNSITSICRHSAMTGYSHTERFIANNFYFSDEEDVINWGVVLLRECPSIETLRTIVTKYKLHVPTYTEVVENFSISVGLYKFNVDREYMNSFFSKLLPHQLTFIYYSFNLYILFTKNTEIFKNWISYLFQNPDLTKVDQDIDPKSIYKLDGDLLTMIVATHPQLVGDNLISKIPYTAPDIARKLILIHQDMSRKLLEVEDLFNIFFMAKVDIPNVNKHKFMLRKCVTLSDTDSIIFTTKSWVEWYTGNMGYNADAYRINALVIYLVSKSLVHTFAILSTNMGIAPADRRLIAIKNEFYYKCMLRTPMAKHYVGLVYIIEGRHLPKPKPDLKGKNLRGSDLSLNALEFTKNFLLGIIDEYTTNLTIVAGDLIYKVLLFEQDIVDSIDRGDSVYLGSDPINRATSYKKPESTAYFYYLLWTEVFADDYAPIYPPQKCKVVPISDKLIRSTKYLDWLKDTNPKLADKLIGFLNKYPKKAINRIFIPPQITIPVEIRSIVLVKSVIRKNIFPVYLALRALGIGIDFGKKNLILSDIYKLTNTIDKELLDESSSTEGETTED